MFDREPLSGPAEPRHDLVADQEHPVPVADLAQARVVLRRGDDPGVAPRDGLHDDRGDRLRVLELDDLADVVGAVDLAGRVAQAKRAPVAERVLHHHGPPDPGLDALPPRISGHGQRARGRAVVTPAPGDHLLASRRQPGHPHRGLVGRGPPGREEHVVEIAGRDLRHGAGQPAPLLVRELGSDVAQVGRLGLDRAHHPRVPEPQVQVHQLGGEVEVALPLGVPKHRAAAPGDHHRPPGRLSRPRVQQIPPIIFDDPLGHRRRDRLAWALCHGARHCRLPPTKRIRMLLTCV